MYTPSSHSRADTTRRVGGIKDASESLCLRNVPRTLICQEIYSRLGEMCPLKHDYIRQIDRWQDTYVCWILWIVLNCLPIVRSFYRVIFVYVFLLIQSLLTNFIYILGFRVFQFALKRFICKSCTKKWMTYHCMLTYIHL